MADLLIHNCDILRVEGGNTQIEQYQDIAITGNRIQAIGSSAGTLLEDDRLVIDARGMLAIPGLINTHAHVPMVLFRGLVEDVTIESWFNDYIWPLESNLTPEDVYWGALAGMAEMIEGGVTSVADHYFAMDQVAQAVLDSGMRANLGWAIFEQDGPGKLDLTSKFVADWQGKGGGRVTTWLAPHAPYTCGPAYLRLCANRAKELGVGIHTHVSETLDQVKMSQQQYGMTPVQVLADSGVLDVPTILAHCAFPTDEDIPLLAAHNTGVAHAPKTFMKLGSGIVRLDRFLKAGVPVGLATDGAVSNNTLDVLEQMKIMALAQKHIHQDSTQFTVPEVLDIAFHGSAQVFHQEADLGAIAPGKLADLALVRQDGIHTFPRFNPAANLVYSTRTTDVDTVICDGKILMRGGSLQTIDKAEVKRQISRRLERLSQRVPGKRIATYPV
jgi:5-methylthioadenosine/S-adenosylhomocysteine deaminase